MQGNWIKIVLFVLGAFMLAAIAQVLLDPGFGKPEESRRTRHPAGFSFVPPRGWGGTVVFAREGETEDYMRVSPEQSAGRQPSIAVVRSHVPLKPHAEAVPYTFQGQPAFKVVQKTKYDWIWRIVFEREGTWYLIAVTSPMPIDIEDGPLWPFLESFRVEQVLNIAPGTMPATVPAANAGEPATAAVTRPSP